MAHPKSITGSPQHRDAAPRSIPGHSPIQRRSIGGTVHHGWNRRIRYVDRQNLRRSSAPGSTPTAHQTWTPATQAMARPCRNRRFGRCCGGPR
eukprot:3749074-Prymnesium_polylepis.1